MNEESPQSTVIPFKGSVIKLPSIHTDRFVDMNTQNVYFYQSAVLFCGQSRCESAYTSVYGPGIRSHFLLTYIKSGWGVYETRDEVHRLGPGASFVAFPGEQVFYKPDEHDPWHYYWIAFEGEEFADILRLAKISPSHSVAMLPENERMSDLFEELIAYAEEQRSYSDIKIVSLTLDILYQYLENAKERESISHQYRTEYVDWAVKYICSHFHKDISVSQIAGKLGITREHFSFLFKKECGVSPSRFILEYRLQRAMIMVTSTDESIENISRSVGFHSYRYFSTQFKKAFDFSPANLRKVETTRML